MHVQRSFHFFGEKWCMRQCPFPLHLGLRGHLWSISAPASLRPSPFSLYGNVVCSRNASVSQNLARRLCRIVLGNSHQQRLFGSSFSVSDVSGRTFLVSFLTSLTPHPLQRLGKLRKARKVRQQVAAQALTWAPLLWQVGFHLCSQHAEKCHCSRFILQSSCSCSLVLWFTRSCLFVAFLPSCLLLCLCPYRTYPFLSFLTSAIDSSLEISVASRASLLIRLRVPNEKEYVSIVFALSLSFRGVHSVLLFLMGH